MQACKTGLCQVSSGDVNCTKHGYQRNFIAPAMPSVIQNYHFLVISQW